MLVSVKVVLSQTSDSLSSKLSVQRSKDYLTDTLKTGLIFYNGVEHPGYFRGIKGIAYLESEQMTLGRVKYDDVWYSVPMMYDLYGDKLVITHFEGFYKISLINERIDEFILHDRVFKYLSKGNLGPKILPGLFEVLYEGDSISVYAKKRKFLNERSTVHGLERDFISSNQYYVRISGKYYQVNSKRDMFSLMGGRRKDVAAQLRKNKIKFRKNKEEALVIASKVYDEKI